MSFLKFIKYFLITMLVFLPLNGCKKIVWEEFEGEGKKRARQNVEEGKGITGAGGLLKSNRPSKRGGSFEFASSNELWRATLDTLDFMSFSNVDYSGGLIITDWYSESENNQAIKITVRFLTNEIRADGLKVSLHQRICGTNNSCAISEVKSPLNEEIKVKILRKASILKKQTDDEFHKNVYKKKKSSDKIKWCGDGRTVC